LRGRRFPKGRKQVGSTRRIYCNGPNGRDTEIHCKALQYGNTIGNWWRFYYSVVGVSRRRTRCCWSRTRGRPEWPILRCSPATIKGRNEYAISFVPPAGRLQFQHCSRLRTRFNYFGSRRSITLPEISRAVSSLSYPDAEFWISPISVAAPPLGVFEIRLSNNITVENRTPYASITIAI